MVFLSFLIIAYKVFINASNIERTISSSTKIPAFILIFSPYCPHCTKVHPDWLKLMDQYENDTKVIIAECNAISDGESCRKIFDYKGFPSFIAFTRRRGLWLRNIDRTLPSFVNETERLKKIDLSFPCPLFKSDFVNEYPAITFNSGVSKDESCTISQRIEKLVPELSSFLYVGDENESKLVAKLTQSNKVVFNGEDNDQNYADFIKEYAIKQFEAHNIRIKYTQYKRKVILLIYTQPGHIRRLQTLGEDYFQDFIFTTYYYRTFNKTYPNIHVTPLAALVSNQDKTKFALFNNISIDANSTKDFLELIKNNKYEANLDMKNLFPRFPPNNQRIKIVNPENQQQKKASEQKTVKKTPEATKNIQNQKEPEKKNVNENNENEKQTPLHEDAKIEKIESIGKENTNSKFMPVFLFVVGLAIMVSIGIFAYCKIKGKNIAKIE